MNGEYDTGFYILYKQPSPRIKKMIAIFWAEQRQIAEEIRNHSQLIEENEYKIATLAPQP
jgi:hypothetical protein